MRPSSVKLNRIVRGFAGKLLDFLTGVLEVFLHVKNENIETYQVSQFVGKVAIFSVYIQSEYGNDWEDVVDAILSSGYKVVVVNTGPVNINYSKKNVHIVNRRNRGRDIASYGIGLKIIEIEKCESLVLINDSIIWNSKYVTKILKSAYLESMTIYGLTMSLQKNKHLQTYFLVFPKDVFSATKYFMDLPEFRFKRTVVRRGELGASMHWTKLNFSILPILDYNDLEIGTLTKTGLSEYDRNKLANLCNDGIFLNPTIHFWPEFFRQTGCLKKSIPEQNPAHYAIYPDSVESARRMAGNENLRNFV